MTEHDRLEARLAESLRTHGDRIDRPSHSLAALVERSGGARRRTPSWGVRSLAGAALAIGVVGGVASALVWSDGDTDLNTSDETPPADGTVSTPTPPTTSDDTALDQATSSTTATTGTTATTEEAALDLPPAAGWIVAPYGDFAGPGDIGEVVGRWDGTAWVPVPPDAPDLAGTNRWLGLDGSVTSAEPPAPELSCTELSATPQWTVDLTNEMRGRVGVPAGIDPRPRAVTEIAVAPEHLESVRLWVAEQDPGLAVDLDTTVTAAFRVDLEGDGTDEVVLVASHLTYEGILISLPAGDHSVVLIRRVDPAGGVDTIEVAGSIVTTADLDPDTGIENFVDWVDVSGIADLNGDGVMEIVLATQEYEGSGVAVYSSGDDPERLLRVECGA